MKALSVKSPWAEQIRSGAKKLTQKEKTMKAKEAAQYVIDHPDTPCFFIDGNMVCDAIRMIPEYNGPLPRRAWIKTFLTTIPDDLRPKFADLK